MKPITRLAAALVAAATSLAVFSGATAEPTTPNAVHPVRGDTKDAAPSGASRDDPGQIASAGRALGGAHVRSPNSGATNPPPPPPPPPSPPPPAAQIAPEDLAFSEFFKMPVGPLGLETTDKLRSLQGKRVRLRGFMAKMCACKSGQCRHVPGRMLLSSIPVVVDDGEMTFCDDLPPTTVYVTVPRARARIIPYAHGPLTIVGVLSVGNKEEPDGRVSLVRIELDQPPESPGANGAGPGTPPPSPNAPSKAGSSPASQSDRSPSDAIASPRPNTEGEKK